MSNWYEASRHTKQQIGMPFYGYFFPSLITETKFEKPFVGRGGL